MKDKKILLSGIQPSGELCIANYIGAIQNWTKLQDKYSCVFLVVDMHSITIKQNPAELRNRCLSFVGQYIASGINPQKNIIAIQSHIPQHAELMWVLGSITYMGELKRMTQYKDKISKYADNINMTLFSYPVLMASDILLYQADLVPVGDDQKQHLELARNIAKRFNTQYSETFKLPSPLIGKLNSRIMSLQDPMKKMSKSDANPNNYIALLDSPNVIIKKIRKAVTDSGSKIKMNDNKPGIENLINIYSCIHGDMSKKNIIKEFSSKNYSQFKESLCELLIEKMTPIQQEYKLLMKDKEYLINILKRGADESYIKARKTLSKVHRKIGFLRK